MQKTDLVGFRASPSEREKLEALAAGERCTISEVLRRLLSQTPVEEVKITGLTFQKQNRPVYETAGGFAN